jgi:hypothetical protein
MRDHNYKQKRDLTKTIPDVDVSNLKTIIESEKIAGYIEKEYSELE